jgi:glucoamylase
MPAMTVQRGRLKWGAATLAFAVLITGYCVTAHLIGRRHVALYALAVAVQADGSTADVRTGDALIPESRVFAGGPAAIRKAAEQQRWLRAGAVPTIPELGTSTMSRDALLDLNVLTGTNGPTVAAWAGPWKYVWPRDSALVASAFARTGHLPEAMRLLDFLQAVQPSDGLFQARYRIDGTVPDQRGVQLDGTGWALWALNEVRVRVSATEQSEFVRRYQRLLDTSAASAERLAGSGGLPPPSPDYWEVKESKMTLATCAILLAGLKAGAALYDVNGDVVAREAALRSAELLETATLAAFSANGFPRHVGGVRSSVDLGVALLSQPFANVQAASVQQAWGTAPSYMLRPAGGLAPGGSWRRDGISWTPAVSVWAMTAACADRSQAVRWLRWLDLHRTSAGSLPEKVLADGSPAAAAPLAFSAAAVLIATDELQHGC